MPRKRHLILPSYAKVNLHLDIGPKRSDGYHSLKTKFQEISLHDTLKFELTPGPIELRVSNKKIPSGPQNIVVKALQMLKHKWKISHGLRVSLEKKIPHGAGLGGGSSNAAAALRAAMTLWRPKKSAKDLFPLAKKLGADVPFFLKGGKAKASGIGEKLTALPKGAKKWMVLVYPRVQVSTADAYSLLDQFRKKSPGRQKARAASFNSFEPVILSRYPKIAKAHLQLSALGCQSVMMSGSGSTVYGFVRSKKEGEKILRQLKNFSWDTYLVHTR